MNDVVSIISTVGFPIAACMAMGYVYVKEIAGMKDSIAKLDKSIEILNEHLGCLNRGGKDEN
mgnify:FL=1|jgi:hypothetical protein